MGLLASNDQILLKNKYFNSNSFPLIVAIEFLYDLQKPDHRNLMNGYPVPLVKQQSRTSQEIQPIVSSSLSNKNVISDRNGFLKSFTHIVAMGGPNSH